MMPLLLRIANQFVPPFWTPNKAFVASDDSLNVTGDKFDEEIISHLNIPVGKNKVLQYLEDEDKLCGVPAVGGDFLDVVHRVQLVDRFAHEVVIDHITFCDMEQALPFPHIIWHFVAAYS